MASVEISTAVWRLAQTPHSNMEALIGEGVSDEGVAWRVSISNNLHLGMSKSWLKMDESD